MLVERVRFCVLDSKRISVADMLPSPTDTHREAFSFSSTVTDIS
jgi:hypothetical protein